MNDPASQLDPVVRLSEEFVERYRGGERPTIDEYARHYPELATEIRDLFPSLMIGEELAPSGSLPASSPPPERPAPLPRRIGDYRIVREIGRGGMGIVYEAEQRSLGRQVALKVLSGQVSPNANALQRFQLEARAAAGLHHAHIVPVYDVGEADGMCYYAMQLIPGQGLEKVLVELRRLRGGGGETGPDDGNAARTIAHIVLSGCLNERVNERPGNAAGAEHQEEDPAAAPARSELPATEAGATTVMASDASLPDVLEMPGGTDLSGARFDRRRYYRGVARIGIQVAHALQCAHREGIVHRDIKPSNLLLDRGGHVWVTDFGLAKGPGDDLTQTGDVVGTLRYMAPERFRGASDPRSDIYSLGITLYELLVGRPAFAGEDRVELMLRVSFDSPPPPRDLDPLVPRELETIVLKSIAKEPAERYSSAAELAEDLQRYLEDKPIHARRAGTLERSWRWYRRNRVVATLGCLLIGVLATSLVTAVGFWRYAAGQRDRAERSARIARNTVNRFVDVAQHDQQLNLEDRHAVFQLALDYYEQFNQQADGEPELQPELAGAQQRVGAILQLLGRNEEALAAVLKSRDLYEALVNRDPGNVASQYALAAAEGRVGRVNVSLGNGPSARRRFQRGLEILEDSRADPLPPEALAIQADLLGGMASALALAGEAGLALKTWQREFEIRERLHGDDPHDDANALAYVTAEWNVGTAQLELGSVADSIVSCRRAIQLLTDLRDRFQFAELTLLLSQLYGQMSRAQCAAGAFPQALESASAALRLHDELPGERLNRRHGWIRMSLLHQLAVCELENGLFEPARQHFEQVVTLQRKRVHGDGGYLARCLTDYGESLRFHADGASAVQWLQQSVRVCREFLSSKPWHNPTRHQLARALRRLAEGYAGNPRFARQAETWLEEAIAIHDTLKNEHPEVPLYTVELAGHHRTLGRLRLAEEDTQRAAEHLAVAHALLEEIERAHGALLPVRRELARLRYDEGLCFARRGRGEEAIAAYRESLRYHQQISGDRPPGHVNEAIARGSCYLILARLHAEEDPAPAHTWAGQAVAMFEAARRGDPRTRSTSLLDRARKLHETTAADASSAAD